MGPAFLRLAEALIDRRIITYQNAVERRFIQDLLKRLTVFVDAIEHHGERLGQKSPDAVDAPARFVAVHDGRIASSMQSVSNSCSQARASWLSNALACDLVSESPWKKPSTWQALSSDRPNVYT